MDEKPKNPEPPQKQPQENRVEIISFLKQAAERWENEFLNQADRETIKAKVSIVVIERREIGDRRPVPRVEIVPRETPKETHAGPQWRAKRVRDTTTNTWGPWKLRDTIGNKLLKNGAVFIDSVVVMGAEASEQRAVGIIVLPEDFLRGLFP